MSDLQLHVMKERDVFVIAVDVLPVTAGMSVNSSTLVKVQYLIHDHNGAINNDGNIEEQHASARTSSQQTIDQEN